MFEARGTRAGVGPGTREDTSVKTSGGGSVAGLWRFPVKSMKGEPLAQADLTTDGLLGDRAYALIDVATAQVASAKSVQLFPGLLDCTAEYVAPPRTGEALPAVRITLPDGRSATSDSPAAEDMLSAHFRREVRLGRAAPPGYAIHEHQPDRFYRPPLDAARIDALTRPATGSGGGFFDLVPVSLITHSTLARLAELAPRSRFDVRRFRMNVVVDWSEPGFAENGWVGREVALGAGARLRVALLDPRCSLTTLAQGDLALDPEVMRTMTEHNRHRIAGKDYPCAGVYTTVVATGKLRVGDQVEVR